MVYKKLLCYSFQVLYSIKDHMLLYESFTRVLLEWRLGSAISYTIQEQWPQKKNFHVQLDF